MQKSQWLLHQTTHKQNHRLHRAVWQIFIGARLFIPKSRTMGNRDVSPSDILVPIQTVSGQKPRNLRKQRKMSGNIMYLIMATRNSSYMNQNNNKQLPLPRNLRSNWSPNLCFIMSKSLPLLFLKNSTLPLPKTALPSLKNLPHQHSWTTVPKFPYSLQITTF